VTAFPALMQAVDCDPEQLLGDKGYDSDAVRQEIADRGGEALIPTKSNRKIQYTVDKAIYGLRNRIERFFNRLKNSRRVATRYDKLLESFAAFVILATIRIWIRFVHGTSLRRFANRPTNLVFDRPGGVQDCWWQSKEKGRNLRLKTLLPK
jgi:transposase